jgi:hypothetical protein
VTTSGSSTYAALPGSPGPSVTVTVPTSGDLFVGVTAQVAGNASSTSCFASFTVNGTPPTDDSSALTLAGAAQQRATATNVISGLTPGSTITLTELYRNQGTGNTTCTWQFRAILAIPLPGAVATSG